ncbi:hypothetical protein [Acinetobacter guerrae]|uniref:hypothetical protein n=1 Tax=Acinetobacter guerrae TaxID=1843371 RepID=UPI00125FE8A5|nr:hypothetical protein [Acinetobacter guerrae]
MNKSLFYTHRIMVFFYGLILTFLWIAFISLGKSDEITFLFFITVIYVGLGFLHLKASNAVKKGLEVGKNLSQGLGCLMLIGFPLGTMIGIFILINTSKKKWQMGNEEIHANSPNPLNE